MRDTMDSDSEWFLRAQNTMQNLYFVQASPSYLMCPPDHQVRKKCNPTDWTKKRDRKKFSWPLQKKQRQTVNTYVEGCFAEFLFIL